MGGIYGGDCVSCMLILVFVTILQPLGQEAQADGVLAV